MSAPLYKPPIKVTTIQIPWQAIVQRADPDWARAKHREPEYYDFSSGKIFLCDPYKVGAYTIPVKRVTISYANQTFNAGDTTNLGQDFVYLTSTNPNPGVLTTRTAAQMIADIQANNPNISPPFDYILRINNIGGAGNDLILQPDPSIVLAGTPLVHDGTFNDIRVFFTDAADATMTVWTNSNPYNSVAH